ncbi:MAG TPA: peroxiredoxin-like family protein [Polyangiaceae bacterium]
MRDILPAIREAGAELVVVGNGSPEFARAFRDELGLDGPLYTDPTLRTYALAGFKRGVLATFSPKGVVHAARAMRKGFRQTARRGDALQQGGLLVVDRSGRILYAHRDSEAGDLAPNEEVLAALHVR